MMKAQSREAMAQCPMASMCKGMAEKPHSRLLLILPGLVLILVGVVILVEPRILVWLMAAVAIILGVLFLMIGNYIQRMGRQSGGASS
jgi:type III secretory pathway component EscV